MADSHSTGEGALRATPNFLLLYGGDDNRLLLSSPSSLTGGERRRYDEGQWEVVGLYHDEDEAFEALAAFEAGRDRGAGQLVLAQINDCAYGSYDAAGVLVIHENETSVSAETECNVAPAAARKDSPGAGR